MGRERGGGRRRVGTWRQRQRRQLGAFETIVPNWSVGDEFTTGDGRRFRITGIVPVDDDIGVYNALWKVAPVTD